MCLVARAGAPVISQRIASAWRRSGRTSTGHLVGRAADAARANLDRRLDVVERLVEHLHRIAGAVFCLDAVERAVDDALGDGLLAVVHQVVHELGQHRVAELGVRQDFALFGAVTSRHARASPYFGRLAPYFERRCLRSLTPWVSSTPRRMW